MGEEARRRAAGEFSVERMVREHEALYTSLLARQEVTDSRLTPETRRPWVDPSHLRPRVGV